MTSRTRMRWRNAAGSGAVCLLVAAFAGALWYGATYHALPGMVPTVVHWCGRDYQTGDGGARNWAQITAAEEPRRVRVVGSPCAMAVYVRTGQNRYQPYTLEGGP